MVVDTSAVLAILLQEPEAADYTQRIENDLNPLISAASVFETGIVLVSRYGPEARDDLRDFLEHAGLQIEPVTAEQADQAVRCLPTFRQRPTSCGSQFWRLFCLCALQGDRSTSTLQRQRLFPDGYRTSLTPFWPRLTTYKYLSKSNLIF
jgi:ribonuclease VapC